VVSSPFVLGFALLAGCLGDWPADRGFDQLDLGFLYVGLVGDHGWTLTHEEGRQAIEENLEAVTTAYEPSVIPADAPARMDAFVEAGANVIITTSYDFLSATQAAASAHPDVLFLNCSGFAAADNMGSYFGRMYQPWYLAGMVAASQSCTGRLGVVGAVTIPETVRHINAFTLGAREVDPSAVVHVEWIGAWFDVEREPEVTTDLIAAGADVIVNQTDTTIPLETAAAQTSTCDGETVTVWSIGYDNADSCDFAPESCLTAPYWNWGPLYVRLLEEIRAGIWDPRALVWDQMLGTPEDSTVALAPMSDLVDSAVGVAVESRIPELTAAEGIHRPFVGPLRDVNGALRVDEGDGLDDEALLRMCWFVEGVVSTGEDGSDAPGEVPNGCGGDY